MTLTQLRYVAKIAQTGSISQAAAALFVSQPSLSKAVAELEAEMGITIFSRSNRGVHLTDDGVKFLAYANQVLEQADLLEQQYKAGAPTHRAFAVSTHHYAFAVNAFVDLVKEYDADTYDFSLRESRTNDIIEDVRLQRSDLGVLYLSHFNREVMLRIIQNAHLKFEPLFVAQPHVFVGKDSPLARKKKVSLDDLAPYPRLTYEQGVENSFYFAEELHITADAPKNIVVTDRSSMFNLMRGLNGYTICSGRISGDLNDGNIVGVPLESDEEMELGYVYSPERPLSAIATRYVELLKQQIAS